MRSKGVLIVTIWNEGTVLSQCVCLFLPMEKGTLPSWILLLILDQNSKLYHPSLLVVCMTTLQAAELVSPIEIALLVEIGFSALPCAGAFVA